VSEHPFTTTTRLMRRMLAEAGVGLTELVKIGERHGISDREDMTVEQVTEMVQDIRTLMRTVGFEGTCVLIQCMLLAGDPMLASILEVQLDRPKERETQ